MPPSGPLRGLLLLVLLGSARPLTLPSRHAPPRLSAASSEKKPTKILFGDLPLTEQLTEQLRANGITAPTPIQAASAMAIVRGGHALVHAETGSGKTLAYLLPVLAKLHLTKPSQLLVVVPSRELALQTAAVVEKAWPHHGTRRACILGGGDSADVLLEQMARAACPVLVRRER